MSSLRIGRPIALALALGLPAATAAGPARADEAISAPRLQYAREQARKGAAYVKAERWAEGRQALREAVEVKPLSTLLFYLGFCELNLGELRDAERHLRRALDLANAPGATGESAAVRRQVIEDLSPHLRDVEARLPRVRLRWAEGPPPGATLTLDGEALEGDEAGRPLGLDPGEHVLTAKAPGRRPREVSFQLAEREAREITLALEPEAPAVVFAPAAPSAAPPKAAEARSSSDWQRPLGYAGLGLGVVLIGVGVFSSLRVQSLEKRFDADASFVTYRDFGPAGRDICALAGGGYEAPPSQGAASAADVRATCDEGRRFAALQYVFYGAGAAFAAAGAYFAFVAPPRGPSTAARAPWQFAPVLAPGRAGVGVLGAF
jgi:hypothetical protein